MCLWFYFLIFFTLYFGNILPLSQLLLDVSHPLISNFKFFLSQNNFLKDNKHKDWKSNKLKKRKGRKSIGQEKHQNKIEQSKKNSKNGKESVLFLTSYSCTWGLPCHMIDIYPVTLHCRKLIFFPLCQPGINSK